MSARKIILLALLFALVRFSASAQIEESAMITQTFEIEMTNDWTSQAELTLPATADGDLPLLILFHGSGPYDMDATYSTDPTGQSEPVSRNFLTIAQTLASQDIAVLRFHKRGVNGYGDYDFAQVQASTLDVLVDDAHAVVDFALELPNIDTSQIYLYGWSEGAWVIANVATMRDDIAGLVMQGAPNGSLARLMPYQLQDIALPYLRDTVDTDGDGLLSLDDIADLPLGPVQYSASFFFYQAGSDPANPTINTFVDSNSDGLIDIDAELAPMIEMYISNISAYLPTVDASYETAELVLQTNIPTLLLHGTLDGWAALNNAEEIAETAPDVVTLEVYPELGHALSITENPAEDGFYTIDPAPLNDLINWIQSQ